MSQTPTNRVWDKIQPIQKKNLSWILRPNMWQILISREPSSPSWANRCRIKAEIIVRPTTTCPRKVNSECRQTGWTPKGMCPWPTRTTEKTRSCRSTKTTSCSTFLKDYTSQKIILFRGRIILGRSRPLADHLGRGIMASLTNTWNHTDMNNLRVAFQTEKIYRRLVMVLMAKALY